MNGWIGVDLDGTLAHYVSGQGVSTIGAPIPRMVTRVQVWLAEGREVRIVTARVAGGDASIQAAMIRDWCLEHIGTALFVTNSKDYGMLELWDDRAVGVVVNTGERADGKP